MWKEWQNKSKLFLIDSNKSIALFVASIKNLKPLKNQIFSKNH